jgi:hypothetical protein
MLEGWLTVNRAVEISGYHPVHLRRLAKSGEVEAVKIGRDWLLNQKSLLSYVRKSEKLGAKRGPKKRP